MSSEKTLYLPCKAAHSPKRLESTVAECIANMIISGSVPQEIKKSSVKSIHNCVSCNFQSTIVFCFMILNDCHHMIYLITEFPKLNGFIRVHNCTFQNKPSKEGFCLVGLYRWYPLRM